MAITELKDRRIGRLIIVTCTLMMLLGVGIRFTFLDGKIFGNDEATTSLHVSGKTITQYAAAVFDGQPRAAEQLLAYQRPDPAHGIRDVVGSLAVEDPQHPPLYYILERQWELGAGSSVSARRLLSAMFGAMSVLSAVWLGVELSSGLAGLIAGALVAASPFAIVYSQVAREYSLWIALTFAATALFIRAARSKVLFLWLAYALVAIAGLYTDALFIFVLIAHAFAILLPTPRRRSTLIGFSSALILAVIAYGPWILALKNGLSHGVVTNNVYLSGGLSLKVFALKWLFNVGTLFYDADYLYPKTAFLIIPGLAALALAFVACTRRLRDDGWNRIVFLLAGVCVVALVLPDIVHHEQRSTASRYLVPLWVACYSALGVGLAIALQSSKAPLRWAALGFVLLTAATGFGSFAIAAKRETWWVDGSTAAIGPIARTIRRAQRPMIIYHATWGPGRPGPELWDFSVVMLANIVGPTTQFAQFGRDDIPTIPPWSGDSFLLDPDAAAFAAIRARGREVVKTPGDDASAVSTEISELRRGAYGQSEGKGLVSTVPSLWTVRSQKGI